MALVLRSGQRRMARESPRYLSVEWFQLTQLFQILQLVLSPLAVLKIVGMEELMAQRAFLNSPIQEQ
jgi:hypothetical protein